MEEFTFPSFPLGQCNAKDDTASPWLVVPGDIIHTAKHEHDHRRSFLAVKQQAVGSGDHYLGAYDGHHHSSARFAEEDKMDMLWEDFNEEFALAAQPWPLTIGLPSWATAKESSPTSGDCYEGTAKTPKHSVVRRKRIGLLKMLKLIKKLFLARKSSASPSTNTLPI
ncbi:unnamed protein product [Urochloa humidicola]